MSKIKIVKFGKYKLLKSIAKGGMAEIFLACIGSMRSAKKFVVIKRILPHQTNNKEFSKMFQNEGKVASNLNHSHIAVIHEFGLLNNQYFICMEYISGRNLRQLMKKLQAQKKKMSLETAVYIIKTACLGMDYAHNCIDSSTGQPFNVIHRDISPQNIMVGFNGDIKVIDFGIAKIDNSETTRVGVLKGKFEYMSPEQVQGKEMDRQTDIFSLGNVLWELLAERKLFIGTEPMQLLRKIKSCHIPDLKSINPHLPDDIVKITHKALHPNKNIRYKTMQEMGDDLSLFLNKNYPQFTQNSFISFLRRVYKEEIIEERNLLKSYNKELDRTMQKDVVRFMQEENARYSGTFTAKSRGGEEEAYDEERTVTQGKTPGPVDITEIKFEDRLDEEVGAQPKKSLLDTQDFFKTGSVELSSVSEEINSYKPWLNNSQKVVHRSKAKARGKTNSLMSAVKYLCYTAVLAGVLFFGMHFFKSGKIQNLAYFQKFFPETKKPLPKKAPRSPSSPRKNISKGVSVFISTTPSGASIFINGREIDDVTPLIVKAPHNKPLQLTLKKKGFMLKKMLIPFAEIKSSMEFRLTRNTRLPAGQEAIILNE